MYSLPKRRIILLVILVGVVGTVLLYLDHEPVEVAPDIEGERQRRSPPDTTVHSSSPHGLRAVSSDGALPPLAWGEKRPEYDRLLQDAPQITPHEPDDARFLELGQLLLWSIPFGLPGDDGRVAAECAAKYEPQLQGPCQWKTNYILRRVGSEEVAQLEYLQVIPTKENDDPACFAFASCTASVWSRQVSVPMPRSLGEVFAFHEFGRGARWTPSKGDREQFYQQALEEAKGQQQLFQSQVDLDEQLDDPMFRYNFEWTRRHVEEFENVLAAMKRRDD